MATPLSFLVALVAASGASAMSTYLVLDSVYLAGFRVRWVTFWEWVQRRMAIISLHRQMRSAAGKRVVPLGGVATTLVSHSAANWLQRMICSWCGGVFFAVPSALVAVHHFVPHPNAIDYLFVGAAAWYFTGFTSSVHDASGKAWEADALTAEWRRKQLEL